MSWGSVSCSLGRRIDPGGSLQSNWMRRPRISSRRISSRKSANRGSRKMPDGATEFWGRLRSTGTGDGRLEVPSLSTKVETGYGPALYAVGPAGEPRLLVPYGSGSPPKDLGSGPNLFAGISVFKIEGRSVPFIDVMVSDRKLDNVFAELVGEILVRLGDGQPPAKAVSGTILDFSTLLLG